MLSVFVGADAIITYWNAFEELLKLWSAYIIDRHKVDLPHFDSRVDLAEFVKDVPLNVFLVVLGNVLPLVANEQRRLRAKLFTRIHHSFKEMSQLKNTVFVC